VLRYILKEAKSTKQEMQPIDYLKMKHDLLDENI